MINVYNSTPRSSQKYTGEGGKKYRKSPVPVLKSPVWVQDVDDIDLDQESVRTLSSGSPDCSNGKPPLPPSQGYDSEGNPKPPPRSRPKSWTSTLFNAFRSGANKLSDSKAGTNFQRDRNTSSVTLSSINTNTMEKKNSYRFPKQVRFLANPSKALYANQKFYSLPHFAKAGLQVQNPEKVPEEERAKARSRTPSPFGRLVKSFVKGNRGNLGKCVNLKIFTHLETFKSFKVLLNIVYNLFRKK